MRKYLFLGVSLTVLSLPALAQDGAEAVAEEEPCCEPQFVWTPSEKMITVTATGTRDEVEDTGRPVTVFGAAEIVDIQGADLSRVLQRAPGVTFSRNGSIGSFSGVRVRGAEAEQLVVLVDGVRISDPASPAGGFDFGNLLTGNAAKLDLLRTSNSTLWGSDAIGGVLLVSTRTNGKLGDEIAAVTSNDRASGHASVEYGARDTLFLTASGGMNENWGGVGASGSYFRTDGFSSAASGSENDGFEQWAGALRGDVDLSYSVGLFANARYAESTLEFDGFPAPSFALADTAELQETRQYSAVIGASYDSGPFYLQASYSAADTERRNFDPAIGTAATFASDGHTDRIDVHGQWQVIGPILASFGTEYEWTEYETLFSARASTAIFAAYAQLGYDLGDLSARVGARHSDHRRFGGTTTFGADLSYEIDANLRLRASVGEGFKAPTLFQLFSDFGNRALQPEQSTSFDLGLSWKNRGWLDYWGVALFRRESENLIDFVSCFGVTGGICLGRPFGTYDNVGRARAQGIEVEAGKRFGSLNTRAAYAYIDTENRARASANAGNRLARRPRHALTLSADWTVADDNAFSPKIGADLRYVSAAFDDAANTVRLDDHAIVDLRLSKPVAMIDGDQSRLVELFGRVENLFDEDYQTAAGYAQAGRGMFAGVRVVM